MNEEDREEDDRSQPMQRSRDEVDREMASLGFYPAASHAFLPEQYFVEYRRKKTP